MTTCSRKMSTARETDKFMCTRGTSALALKEVNDTEDELFTHKPI